MAEVAKPALKKLDSTFWPIDFLHKLPMICRDRFNSWSICGFLALWAASCIHVPFPTYFWMQHVPTFLAVMLLIAAERNGGLDRIGFTLFVIFLLLHLVGARYLYSYVPYDDWLQAILGVRLTDYFGFARNHYDRLAHFSFGLLLVYPVEFYCWNKLRLRGWIPPIFAISAVLAASAAYEIGEWAIASTFAPDWAEAYNGQQGDPWDAQHDMALAWGGAMIGVILVCAIRRWRKNGAPSAICN